jgi:hypothetical protein
MTLINALAVSVDEAVLAIFLLTTKAALVLNAMLSELVILRLILKMASVETTILACELINFPTDSGLLGVLKTALAVDVTLLFTQT